ncbi:dynamin central domain-containing protein [Artemisia annua]|uniref:Dynamin central domain-containing protein n=1 Tax=Artemisia annua TaxID=35608 RepID=A0A2U1Q097_ARTAN|nr:dynamin central domain-containing protein [Artemisia annua]
MVTSTNVARQVKVDTTTTNGFHDHKQNFPPLVSSFNDKIRPILDAVDKLRSLNITQEGIALPTIVVVGDQSSGKSSVLESLAGISLPRGQEICTRVPLIMRLQHHPDDVPEFVLEYKNETVNIMDESRISEAIEKATVEVAGNYKGIANVPLTLMVKKKGVPDLTMVDLPGITRVPIGDQPGDIYEQISEIISKCLPDIVKKINERLNASISELNKLPITLTSVPDAMVAFMQIVGSIKETLQRILIRGEFDQYEDDNQMHCNARLVEMLDEFSIELNTSIKFSEDFLVEEMKVLEEANGIRLPNFLPHSVFLCLLQRKVSTISDMPVSFVDKVWSYLETVCVRVLTDRCDNYPQLLPSMRKATLHVMREKKVQFEERVVEMIEMEKITDYTCDPEFTASYNKLMEHSSTFSSSLSNSNYRTNVEGYGSIYIRHLHGVAANTRDQAFDLKMRMTAYWKIVLKRMVDWVALQLRFLIQKVVNKEIEMEMNEVIVRGGVDKLRSLNITQEGIALPTIVVVGDQSSGKSSVLESLAGISLPRGQEICTRVPLIMRLQHHPDDVPEFVLEYKNETVNIMDESRISEAIEKATVEVAGNYKGIANVPLTLMVKKKGVPDLTMVDLPGITRVPIGDQPGDIYEQISEIISKCLPDIVKKINERLNASISELNKLPITLTSVPDAMVAFMQIVGSIKETLQRILIRGEFDQYEDDNQMHCNARLVEMLDEFSIELNTSIKFSEDFLVEEMKVLEEANGIRLPNFLPHSVFLCLLQRKVSTISDMPVSFVDKVWSYLETVCVRVLTDRCDNYPQLLPSMRKATLHVMREKKVQFEERVVEMIEMEKITDYTCDPEFTASYNKLMEHSSTFSSSLSNSNYRTNVEGYGSIYIRHLHGVAANTRDQAFDLKMRMTAYWKIVLKRMVDWVALQLRFLIQKVVNKEIEMEMNEVIVRGGGIEKMLDEPPSMAIKREKLQRSIGLLKASKEVIEQVMDGNN